MWALTIQPNMIVAGMFENTTPFQLNLHKGNTNETLFVKGNLQDSFYTVNQKHTTSTKTYQYEDDQSMEPKY